MLYEKLADLEGHLYFTRYDAEVPPNESLAPIPHFHNSIELWIVTRGEVKCFINGEWRHLMAGDVAFIDRFIPHTGGYRCSDCCDEVEYYVLVASNAYLSSISWLAGETLAEITPKKQGFDELLQLIEWNYNNIREGNFEMKTGFVTTLFGYLRDYLGTNPRHTAASNRLAVRIMAYINEHYEEHITLPSLARKFGYEETYLSRNFNKYTGMHLREYLHRIRISEIKRRRRADSSLSLSRAALDCGYENLTTFFHAYNKYGKD